MPVGHHLDPAGQSLSLAAQQDHRPRREPAVVEALATMARRGHQREPLPAEPAQVGRGITACCANAAVSAAQRALADRLMAAVGEVGWVDDEAMIDAVTAVSGSGPAYAFLLAECMAEAGRRAGLPEDLAARLARATVAGAGELLHRSPESAAQLRRNVTSPNGTTAAALEVLMAPDGMQPLMDRAVAAAARRSRELAG